MTQEDFAARGRVAPWDLEMTPRVLWTVAIVCFFAWVISVYDFTLFGTLLPVIADEFGWSAGESTAVATVVQVGVFIVALIVGPIIDRHGRRNALVVLMIGGALASGFTGAVMGAFSLVIVRSISGLSMSEEVVNAVYLNEIFHGVKNRGLRYSIVQGGYPLGALVAAAMSALLLNVIGWRWNFVVAGVFALIIALVATRLPESPTFAAMKEIRRRTATGDTAGAAALRAQHRFADTDHEHVGIKGVFTRELRTHTILLSAAWLLNWIGIQVFSVLGTTVLTQGKNVSFDSALVILIGANAVAFLGYLFHGWVGDRIGRRSTILLGWAIGAVCSFLMLIGPSDAAFVLSFYGLTLFFLTGPYAALLYYMGESFPANVRGVGANVAHVMAPIGAIIGSGLLSMLLFAGVPMQYAAILTGSLGMAASALCMLGTRKVPHHRPEMSKETV